MSVKKDKTIKSKKKALILSRRWRKLEKVYHIRLIHAHTTQTHAPIIPLDRDQSAREPLAYWTRRQRELSNRCRAFATLLGSIIPPAFCLTCSAALFILRPPWLRLSQAQEAR